MFISIFGLDKVYSETTYKDDMYPSPHFYECRRSSILECEVGRLRHTRELSGYHQPGQVGESAVLVMVRCTVIKRLEDQPWTASCPAKLEDSGEACFCTEVEDTKDMPLGFLTEAAQLWPLVQYSICNVNIQSYRASKVDTLVNLCCSLCVNLIDIQDHERS
jgi:hypothetical protein